MSVLACSERRGELRSSSGGIFTTITSQRQSELVFGNPSWSFPDFPNLSFIPTCFLGDDD